MNSKPTPQLRNEVEKAERQWAIIAQVLKHFVVEGQVSGSLKTLQHADHTVPPRMLLFL